MPQTRLQMMLRCHESISGFHVERQPFPVHNTVASESHARRSRVEFASLILILLHTTTVDEVDEVNEVGEVLLRALSCQARLRFRTLQSARNAGKVAKFGWGR